MLEMQFNSNSPQPKCGLNFSASSIFAHPLQAKCENDGTFTTNEPISVLDTRSPSPSNSTSTLSTSAAAVAADLRSPLCEVYGEAEFEKIEAFEKLKLLLQAGSQMEVQGVLGFGSSGDLGGGSASAPACNALSSCNASDVGFSGYGFSLNDFDRVKVGLLDSNGPFDLAPCAALQEGIGTLNPKVEIFNSEGDLSPVVVTANLDTLWFGNNQQEQLNQFQPLMKHHNLGYVTANAGLPKIELPFDDPVHRSLLPVKQQISSHQQFVYDQVYEAARLIEAGNFSNAQAILARLNHFVVPIGEPFRRSAFYIKEALEYSLSIPKNVAFVRIPAPLDGIVFKMSAYKAFSEISPIIQFMNFTANQVLLEALGDAQRIHIIDFDIGFGAHWSSFLQELKRGVTTSVKITAFSCPSTHHSFEISLIHENLTRFANELGIDFELEVVNMDSFNPNFDSLRSLESEAVAVNLPIWSFASYLSLLPSYLRLLKKLSPRIFVALGRGCERNDLPFSYHILHTLQHYEALLDSVDAADVAASDASDKIERFLFRPGIESTVLGRFLCPDIMLPWMDLFASVGFFPSPISNFNEYQAECLLKRTEVRGFHVEKKQASSLSLCWKCCELLSVSAWRC